MANYDVSVRMGLEDNVTKKLQAIEKQMDSVVKSSQAFNSTVEALTRSFNAMTSSAVNATSNFGLLAENLKEIAGAYKDIKANQPTFSSPRNTGVRSPRSNKSLVSDAEAQMDAEIAENLAEFKKRMDAVKAGLGDVKTQLSANVQTIQVWKSELKSIPLTGITDFSQMAKSAETYLTRSKTAMQSVQTFVNTAGFGNTKSVQNALQSVNVLYDNLARAQDRFQTELRETGVVSEQTFNNLITSMHQFASKSNSAMGIVNGVMKKANPEQVAKLEIEFAKLDKEITDATSSLSAFGIAYDKALDDQMTLNNITKNLEKYNQVLDKYEAEANQSKTATDKLNNSLSKTDDYARADSSAINGLTSKLKTLAGAYLTLQSAQKVIETSDSFVLTEGKLSNLTDDVEGMMDDIYQMSQDTRTSYLDNASQMAKMWQLTGGRDGVFDSEEKLLQFNEVLNKAFVLGGSGTREINASIYQLTQALSSGRLQGDELRSMAENAPYLINSITDSLEEMYNKGKSQDEWIELTYGDLKELGAQGVLTSDLIVDAVMSSTDQIRDAYEGLTPTFEQIFQTIKNQVTKISQPILKKLNEVFNSDAFEKTIQSIMKMFAVVMAVLTPIIEGILSIGEYVSDNWTTIEPIVWGIVGVLAIFAAYLVLLKLYTFAQAVAFGIMAAFGKMSEEAIEDNTRAMAVYNSLVPLTTLFTNMYGAAKMFLAGATWAAVVAEYGLLAPIALVIAAFLAIIGVIYLVVWAYNKLTGSTLSATGIIVGAFYWMYGYVYNAIALLWNDLVDFAEFIANVFNDPTYTLKELFGNMAIGVLNILKKLMSGVEWLANQIIELINSVIEAYNGSFLADFFGQANTVKKVKLSGGIDNNIAGIESWIGEPNKTPISYDKYKMEEKDLDEMYQKGYDKGAGWAESISGMFNIDEYMSGMNQENQYNEDQYKGLVDDALKNYGDSVSDYDEPNVGGSGKLPDSVADAIDKIKGNTDDINDNTKITTEELKYLRDLAEQRAINRFTTAEIKITNHMNNNINSDRDLDGIVNYLTDEIIKGANSAAEATHY